MVIWWGMIYKCEYFITLCLYYKAAYKVLSTVKKTEGMRATRRRRSTLKSQLPLWWPLPRSLVDTGANLSAEPKTFVFAPAVCCQEQLVQPKVLEEFLMVSDAHCHLLGARPAMGLRMGWGLSTAWVWAQLCHSRATWTCWVSLTSLLSESVDDGGIYLNDSSTNLKVLDLVLKQQWSNGNSM